MPDVDIMIGGRTFQVACQPGEEQLLRAAAELLDAEARPLVTQMGRLPESRMLLMAALMLADRMAALEDERRALKADV
ncbi:MAG: cell division protein ZapA, partial [Rhodobacterales bacterium]